jgi:predicted transglutaminase-like cysteine proteinase
MATLFRQGRTTALSVFGLLALVVTLAFAAPAQAFPAGEAPVYAIGSYPFQKAPALMRWRSVQQRDAQLMARANPDECKDGEPRLDCAAKESLLLEEKLQDKSPAEQVEAVYAYFNAIKWKEHASNCGLDCWKTRLEFLADREGDCGDHALAEYFTLKRLGFKERDLQLIVAQLPGFADSFKGGHVVLRVRAEDEYFILDNRRNELTDLGGLRRYKMLAGVNADSVQIYNLVTPAPPPGFIADATQVASLVTPPGAGAQPAELVQVAEAASVEPIVQLKPMLVAAVSDNAPESEPGAEPDTANASASFDDGSETMCVQAANLADWNPFLPCTPTKAYKIVVKPKIIIGAEPPKSKAAQPPKPVEVAATTKAPEPKVVAAPTKVELETPEKPKIVAKTVIGATPTQQPQPEPMAKAEEKEEGDSGACTQGATLADWNPELPCSSDGNSSTLRIEVEE